MDMRMDECSDPELWMRLHHWSDSDESWIDQFIVALVHRCVDWIYNSIRFLAWMMFQASNWCWDRRAHGHQMYFYSLHVWHTLFQVALMAEISFLWRETMGIHLNSFYGSCCIYPTDVGWMASNMHLWHWMHHSSWNIYPTWVSLNVVSCSCLRWHTLQLLQRCYDDVYRFLDVSFHFSSDVSTPSKAWRWESSGAEGWHAQILEVLDSLEIMNQQGRVLSFSKVTWTLARCAV